MSSVEFTLFMQQCRQSVDKALNTLMPTAPKAGQTLIDAMSYSLFNGGKRVRPILAYASALAVGESSAQAGDGLHAVASALEAVHAYSLVHDDLPAMDDDDLRRGKATCHIAYDEATAILAGDALQTFAFDVISQAESLNAETRLQLVSTLAKASGAEGMVLGQSIDLNAVDQTLSLPELEMMHAHKTGALIRASVQMGAIATEQASPEQLKALDTYASAIGLAFQVQDDILDVVADTATLGKPQGSDQNSNKPTYVSLLGLEAAQEKADNLHQKALEALSTFDARADHLRSLSAYIVQRGH